MPVNVIDAVSDRFVYCCPAAVAGSGATTVLVYPIAKKAMMRMIKKVHLKENRMKKK